MSERRGAVGRRLAPRFQQLGELGRGRMSERRGVLSAGAWRLDFNKSASRGEIE
jgi:hypothetical protein